MQLFTLICPRVEVAVSAWKSIGVEKRKILELVKKGKASREDAEKRLIEMRKAIRSEK